ncbi:zinc finger BED domain-containing protein 4-like [Coregonus clupeaformis]|uniref:zinc finger BED domain-containing protein 4-like n=1 Tax=Coregonus clupeaformis TaxID=59861 RepID=UPI001BDFCF2E|nr:zinc finger BED domain-containing protein 4-like [Coregonus clupeaformis]
MTEFKRAFSLVWDHFTLVTPNKVQCSLCSQRLSFNKNTSAMLRHLRSRHPSEAWYSNSTSGAHSSTSNSTSGVHSTFSNSIISSAGVHSSFSGTSGLNSIFTNSAAAGHHIQVRTTRQEDLDDALVNMLVKDTQPFSVVEEEGFAAFVQKLDPSYNLPNKQALKKMVGSRCEFINDNVVSQMVISDFVSLTSDMWTSIDKHSYISVTGHLVAENAQLSTFLLGISKLPENHKVIHIEEAKNQLVASWGLHSRVAAFVTETSDNMVATVQKLGILQLPSFAHVLNLVIKRSMEATLELQDIRSQARAIVGFFKSNQNAEMRLAEVQGQLGRPEQKLIQEVDSRWNSSFSMLERVFDQRESVAAALSTLDTDIIPLGSADYEVIHQCLGVLGSFNQATAELASEKRVSASKVIPLVRMLKITLEKKHGAIIHPTATQLVSNLQRELQTSCSMVETEPILALSALLDPRFKMLAFGNQGYAQEAVKLLTSECASLIRINPDKDDTLPPSTTGSTTPSPTSPHTTSRAMETASVSMATSLSKSHDGGLWEMFDSKVGETQSVQSSTADAAVEVQHYLSDPYLNRVENPMHYWEKHSKVYPHLFQLARKYLSVPASSVPCERIFTKAGDVFNKKRSCLSMKAAEQIMLLNKGLV